MVSGVKVYGPGIKSTVLQKNKSKFIGETFGVRTGQLSVRIRSSKGMSSLSLMCYGVLSWA